MFPTSDEAQQSVGFATNQIQTTSSRTPQLDSPSGRSQPARDSKSIRLAVYLYISSHYRISDNQREWIAHFQARLNLTQIQKALKFGHILTTDPRTRARMQITEKVIKTDSGELQKIALFRGKSIPIGNSRPKIREQRRIGVGYRDKGSLPKRSKFDWEADNTITVGLTYEGFETRSWDLTILWDPSEEQETESDGVMSDRRMTLTKRARELQRSPYVLEHPEPKVWKITLPNGPSESKT